MTKVPISDRHDNVEDDGNDEEVRWKDQLVVLEMRDYSEQNGKAERYRPKKNGVEIFEEYLQGRQIVIETIFFKPSRDFQPCLDKKDSDAPNTSGISGNLRWTTHPTRM